MAHRTVPDPPNTTPMFQALTSQEVRDILAGRSIRQFVIGFTFAWARWLSELTHFVRPIRAQVTLDFPSTPAQESSELTATVAGAQTDHFVEVVPPPALRLANSGWDAYVSAANTVAVRFLNFSTGAINPASGVFTLMIRN